MTDGLSVRGLSVRLGGVDALQEVSLDVPRGAVVGVVGPNGAGKTTLIDAVTGFVPCQGTVILDGRRLDTLRPHQRAAAGVARTFQGLELFDDLTVGENLAVAAEARGRRSAEGRVGELVTRAAVIAGLGDLDALPARQSLGRRKRVALGRALAGGPAALLLDEPAAGLDTAERTALARTLRDLAAAGLAVLVVDHDVPLVLDACDRVAVLQAGRVLAQGAPMAVRDDTAVAAAWLGPAAIEGAPGDDGRARGVGRRSPGPAVLELEGVTAGYDGAPVVHQLDVVVGGGEVVALLGANGAGKTTTLLAASGALPLMAGRAIALGGPVTPGPHRMARRGLAHAPQDRGPLGSLTVSEQLRLAARGRGGAVDATLVRFPALAPLLGRRAGVLSGGEQQLLSLARALASRPRLLFVDEAGLGLAPGLARQALAVVRAVADEEGIGVLLAEQQAGLALPVADRAVVLDRGRVVASGPAADLGGGAEVVETAYLGSRSRLPT